MDGKRVGTLSDVDIEREIQADPPLIQNVPPEEPLPDGNFQPAAYDLRVGYIITSDDYVEMNSGDKIVRLRPGGMAILATREVINLPADITGLIVPRDGPAKRGLLILNAGHVDPGHSSFVTAQVINLGKESFPLRIGGSYFSVIFEYLCQKASKPRKKAPPDRARLDELAQQATQLAGSIIDVQKDDLEKRLSADFVLRSRLDRELLARVWWLVVTFVAGAAAGAGIFQAVLAGLNEWP